MTYGPAMAGTQSINQDNQMPLQRTKTVKFDPANKEHRDAVRAFMKRRAWSDTNFRFSHEPEYGSIVDQVMEKLTNWFLEQEESKATKRQKVTESKALAQSLLTIAPELEGEGR